MLVDMGDGQARSPTMCSHVLDLSPMKLGERSWASSWAAKSRIATGVMGYSVHCNQPHCAIVCSAQCTVHPTFCSPSGANSQCNE